MIECSNLSFSITRKLNSRTSFFISYIIDVLYVEQNSDIVLLCSNKILVTNVFGEVVSERHVDEQGAYLDELAKSYKSRSFYGAKNVLRKARSIVSQKESSASPYA